MSDAAFTTWFASQRFRHFGPREFTTYFARERKGVANEVPPKHLWRHIVPVLRIADDLRAHFGKPCRILSSYRSPAYNKAVGGAPLSQHLRFNALDITIDGISPQRVYDKLLEWRREGRFTGGLGLYPSSGFVHIDTRGTNAAWRGR
jgi:uncharacterized protein YcbK (DUF882 family)